MRRIDELTWLKGRLRLHTRRVVGGLIVAVLGGGVATLDPLLMRQLIDVALPRWKSSASLSHVLSASACVLTIGLCFAGRSALGGLGGLVSYRIAQFLGQDLKVDLLSHMTGLSVDWHEHTLLGEKLSRIEQDVEQISQFGADFANSVIRSVVFFTVNLVIMFALNWRMTVSVLPLIPLFLWVRTRFRSAIRQRADHTRAEVGKASGCLAEHLTGVPQIQVLGAEQPRIARTVNAWTKLLSAQWRQRRAEIAFSTAIATILALAILIVLGLGAYEYVLGMLSLGGLVAFYAYATRIFEPVSTAMELYSRTQQMAASVRRVREILETQSKVPDEGKVEAIPNPLVQGLVCKSVSFAYSPGDTVVQDIDLKISRNERIALIGRSGSGKSSLSRLLPRVADPTGGDILLEGRATSEYTLSALRRAVCYVPQHAMLFSGSIRDNLLDGNAHATQNEIDEVIEAAQLIPVLRRLPRGLDTFIGPEASGLSGGERQRLALARALLRHSQILVLDESTSALDLPTEEAVFRAVASFRPNASVILISHRLRSLAWVDRMILLDSGKIVAQGTHSALYRESALYRRLYESDDSDRARPIRNKRLTMYSQPVG
jgi:ABC-type multidrug transport system fused ATPase/permease subunit